MAVWPDAADGEPKLARDINSLAEPVSSNPTALRPFDQAVVFIADDGAHGRELWRSDGTEPGTILLADAVPQSLRREDEPRLLTEVGGRQYFRAGTRPESTLWRTDGTPRGTRPVTEGPPYAPRAATEWNGISYYFDDDGEQVGLDLWRSDGTPRGTYLVVELPDADADTPPVAFGDHLYFFAGDAQHGMELWRTDGTAAGTEMVRDLAPGAQSGWPGPGSAELVANDEYLLFVGRSAEGRPVRLWRSDGTRAGTVPVSPPTLRDPTKLTALGTQVFFVAWDASHGQELWQSDGTMGGTAIVADIEAGPGHTGFGQLLAAGRHLLFIAWTEAYGGELWQSDGTAAGTHLVLDIRPGAAGAICGDFAEQPIALAAQAVIVAADDGVHGCEPWLIDVARRRGTVVDLLPGGASNPRGLSTVGDAVLYAATGSPGDRELWRSDGTIEGTHIVRDIRLRTAPSYPGDFDVIGSRVVFTADDGLHGPEPWTSDGTAQATALLRDFEPGPVGSLLVRAPVGDAVLFSVAEAEILTLWRSDGTVAGSKPIFALPPSHWRQLQAIAPAGAITYFVHDSGLWLTDGQPGGTRLVKQGVEIDHHAGVAVVNEVIYFADKGTLMRSDGSPAGTTIVKQAGPGVIGPLTTAGGAIYFRTSDAAHGAELWRSDGTPAGTRLVRDINPATAGGEAASSAPGSLTPVGDRLFFVATDGMHGREPWVTDGSATNTRMLADINPGPSDSAELEPYDPVTGSAGELFYLIARNEVGSSQLWRSDGTGEGTFLLLERTMLANLTDVRGQLIFAAPVRDDTTAMGLWRSDGTVAGTVPIALLGSTGDGVDHYGAFAVARNRLFFTVALPTTGSEVWSMSIGAAICAGDFDGDHQVSIAEVGRGVATALGSGTPPMLGRLDIDGDRRISVAEIVAAVVNAQAGCSIA